MTTKTTARMLGLVVVLAAAFGLAVTAGAATRTQVFTDPLGDASGGPDIARVTVSDHGGIVTFKQFVKGLKAAPDSGVVNLVGTFLDTNKDGHGEYMLLLVNDGTGTQWEIMKGDKPIKQSPAVSFLASGDTYTLTMSSTDLGGATSFNIWATSGIHGESGLTTADKAPDGGTWSYALTSVKPVLGTPTTSPVAPIAGESLALTMPVTRSDSGAKLTTGATMTLDPSIGGVAVKHTEQLKNGTVSLRLVVPATAKGKVLTVRTAITFAGQTVTKVSSYKIA
jgi:hypothetical protein